MESKIYLRRYRLCLDEIGLPTVLRRSASEGTFKAEDIISHEKVALQIIPAGQLKASAREQLETDARLAQQIRHINIPGLRDFGFESEQLAYVTDYFEGTPADEWIKNHGPLPVAPTLRIAVQIVSAMAAAAFHGVFHPALHPGNLILAPGETAEGEWPLIKLLNFVGPPPSFTRKSATAAGASDAISFASPEQRENGAPDFRSEVYSLGCVLWLLLTGAPPLAGASAVENTKSIPSGVRRLLANMLAQAPNERPLDPIALQERFQDCLFQAEGRERVAATLDRPGASRVARAPAPSVEPAPTRTRASISLMPFAIAALLLTAAAVGGLFFTRYFQAPRSVDQLGVPIGVPEPASTAERTKTETANAPTVETTQPPVLTSAESATEETKEAEPSAAPGEYANGQVAEESPAVASSDQPPVSTETSDSSPAESAPVAQGDIPRTEPEAPAEGPPNESSPPASTPAEESAVAAAETSPVPDPTAASVTAATPSAPEETPSPIAEATAPPQPEPTAAVARSTKRSSNESGPSITDPFGKPLIAPKDEAAPAARPSPAKGKSSRRRPPRSPKPVENRPVLPALPPGD